MPCRKQKRPQLTVGPETARVLKLGHPWVLADHFTRQWPEVACGQLADLVASDGKNLATALLDPQTRIVARVLSPSRVDLDVTFLRHRLDAAETARRWFDLGDTNAWRMINAEGDGLPGLTIDRYGDFAVLQYFTAAWEMHLSQVAQALLEYDKELCGVYAKYRPQETRKLATGGKKKPFSRLLAGREAPRDLTVKECGLTFAVDLVNDLNTGIFPDQRQNRQMLRSRVAGCRFLNLFAYTGAFSVAAAAGGASRVTSVDVSSRYLEQARQNFQLNDIDPADHEFVAGDCFAVLEGFARRNRQFDVVLMDPPSFSTTRRGKFKTGGGTADLVSNALALMAPGGLLITSSNLQKMALNDYLKELRKGSQAAGKRLQILEVSGQAPDFPFQAGFPEGQYLKYVVSVVQEQF